MWRARGARAEEVAGGRGEVLLQPLRRPGGAAGGGVRRPLWCRGGRLCRRGAAGALCSAARRARGGAGRGRGDGTRSRRGARERAGGYARALRGGVARVCVAAPCGHHRRSRGDRARRRAAPARRCGAGRCAGHPVLAGRPISRAGHVAWSCGCAREGARALRGRRGGANALWQVAHHARGHRLRRVRALTSGQPRCWGPAVRRCSVARGGAQRIQHRPL